MSKEEHLVTLNASIAPIRTAVTVSGERDSRVQFDVPMSDLPALLKLAAFGAQKHLRLEIFVVNEE